MNIRENNPGFTLTEMLVVLLICAIGVALAAGVGATVQQDSRAEETRNIQQVAALALKAYHGANDHAYPPGGGEDDSGAKLLAALRSCRESRKLLQRLPRRAVSDEDDSGRRHLLDGFGNRMQYYYDGQAGRYPLLVSNGPDQIDQTDDITSDMY